MQSNTKTVITRDEILPAAQRMREQGRLLIMIHAYLNRQGEPVITYDYDMGPEVACYEVTGEWSVPSIAPIYDAAAEWPERELNELLGITFEGLDTEKRLFLPDNLLDGKGQILVTPMETLREKNHPV